MRHMRQRYGQHFLVNERVIEQIIQSARRLQTKEMVEIGPGKGALTFALIKAGFTHFKAAEIDPEMIAFLKQNLPPQAGVEILEGDFCLLPPGALPAQDTLFVGNLPYAPRRIFWIRCFPFLIFQPVFLCFKKNRPTAYRPKKGESFTALFPY